MLGEFIKELKSNQKINLEKGLENKVDIDYVIKRLSEVSVYFEVAKCEVETAIDDIANDEYYSVEKKKKLDTLTNEDINRIAWKVYDENVWEDVYQSAREEVVEELELE